MANTPTKNALVVRGGWDGHQPKEATELFIPFLETNGYGVRVEGSPQVYADAGYMRTVDLIVQCNTMATIERAEFAGLRAAIEAGSGMAGWHGGIADSYRNSSDYLHLIGGQFACHPGKHPDERIGAQSDNYRPYRINMLPCAADHPITRGIGDFDRRVAVAAYLSRGAADRQRRLDATGAAVDRAQRAQRRPPDRR